MNKYWIELEQSIFDDPPIGTLIGIGVTANSEEEALDLIKECVFKDRCLPAVKTISTVVTLNDLEKNHVRPNIGNMNVKGVWFPLGYSN